MVTSKDIIAVVVIYHPNKLVLKNISTYHSFLKQVIVVDNSEVPNKKFLSDLETELKVELIVNAQNIGIAAALNKGIEKAILLGAEWILTMDQDSYFEGEMLKSYFKTFDEIVDKKNIAVLGPTYTHQLNIVEIKKVKTLITSGSLINAKRFRQLNGYDEKLFIDEVDNDYCYRAQLEGFDLFQCNSIYMNHSLGSIKEIKTILGKKIVRSLHSPVRLYYIIRNALYMNMKYKDAFPEAIKKTRKDVISRIKNNILFGNDKLTTLRYIILGILDFRKRRFGKFNRP